MRISNNSKKKLLLYEIKLVVLQLLTFQEVKRKQNLQKLLFRPIKAFFFQLFTFQDFKSK